MSNTVCAYIFLGTELGKKQDAVNNVREKLKGAEEFVFYADETPAGTIVDTLQNQGLFADSKIVIVKNAELIKEKKEIEQIVSWTKKTKNTGDNAVLILLSDENRLASFENAKANQQIFYEMFNNEKSSWLKDYFKREGLQIDNDCVDTILEMVENNTDALKRECSRLINFIKGQTNNTSLCKEDIEKWLTHNREESAFTLFSRIAAGDLSKALESISIMLAAKESVSGIFAGLTWCFRKLSDYISLQEAGNAENTLELKKLGLSSAKTRADYINAARRYNADDTEACLALTAKYDILHRSPVVVMERILLDRYILTLINLGK